VYLKGGALSPHEGGKGARHLRSGILGPRFDTGGFQSPAQESVKLAIDLVQLIDLRRLGLAT